MVKGHIDRALMGFGLLLSFFLAFSIALTASSPRNYIEQKAAQYVETKLGVDIRYRQAQLSFPNKIIIEDLSVSVPGVGTLETAKAVVKQGLSTTEMAIEKARLDSQWLIDDMKSIASFDSCEFKATYLGPSRIPLTGGCEGSSSETQLDVVKADNDRLRVSLKLELFGDRDTSQYQLLQGAGFKPQGNGLFTFEETL